MRVMRTRIGWLVLVGATLLAPAAARAQTGNLSEVPPVDYTGPLSHMRYEQGGFFAAAQGLYWRQTRPVSDQIVAVRGFVDVDGTVTGQPPGTFVGSGATALNT